MRSLKCVAFLRCRWVPCLAALILVVLPLACTRESSNAPAPGEEGSQVADQQPSEQQPAEATPPPADRTAPTPAEKSRRSPAPEARQSGESTAHAPAPPPEPQTVAVTVPASTVLKIKIEDALNSGTNQPGDHFKATLVDPVVVGDRVALAAGSSIDGTVTDVIPAKKGLKESGGSLTLSFEHVTIPSGESAAMSASIAGVAKSTKKKAGTIGGGAAGGALLGKILGGSTKDAAVGAVIGGAIGTGIAAGTKGTEMKINAGTEMSVSLQQPITLHLKR